MCLLFYNSSLISPSSINEALLPCMHTLTNTLTEIHVINKATIWQVGGILYTSLIIQLIYYHFL